MNSDLAALNISCMQSYDYTHQSFLLRDEINLILWFTSTVLEWSFSVLKPYFPQCTTSIKTDNSQHSQVFSCKTSILWSLFIGLECPKRFLVYPFGSPHKLSLLAWWTNLRAQILLYIEFRQRFLLIWFDISLTINRSFVLPFWICLFTSTHKECHRLIDVI